MNRRIIGTLYKKEMTDIMRDKKTILMMVVVPIILYPLLFLASMFMMNKMATSSTTDTFNIAFADINNDAELEKHFMDISKENDYNFALKITNVTEAEEMLSNGSICAYLSVDESGNAPMYIVHYYSTDTFSQTACQMIINVLTSYRNDIRYKLIEDAGLDADYYLNPISVSSNDMSTHEETVGNIFGMIVPFLLMSSVLMGAMYPAIDVTAGEKERGTLETLLTLPVKSIELITSKFLATSTIAVFSALLNVISMSIMGGYFYESIVATAGSDVLDFSLSTYIPAIFGMLVVITLFALFASAVCLLVCIFAKSFKEAQNYTSPIIIVFMLCGMAGMLPGIELNETTAVIPVVNVALLIANLFALKFSLSIFSTVLLVNLGYTVLAVLIMGRVFSMESVLFGESSGQVRLLERRSNMKANQIPGIGDVVLMLSLVLLVLVYAGSILVLKHGLVGVLYQQLIFLVVTAAYSWYIKTDVKRVFSIKRPSVIQAAGSVITWIGGCLFTIIVTMIMTKLFPGAEGDGGVELYSLYENVPVLGIIVITAIVPAIVEEIVFRGFVFGSLRHRFKPATAIFWSGLLFGLYHMSIVKLPVTACFGMIFAYVVYKTGSIWLSILMHVINNAFADIVYLYPDKVAKICPFLAKETYSAMEMVVIAVIGLLILAVGIIIIKKSNREAIK